MRMPAFDPFKSLSYSIRTLAFHCLDSPSPAEGEGWAVQFFSSALISVSGRAESTSKCERGAGPRKLSPAAARPACCTLFGFRCNWI